MVSTVAGVEFGASSSWGSNKVPSHRIKIISVISTARLTPIIFIAGVLKVALRPLLPACLFLDSGGTMGVIGDLGVILNAISLRHSGVA
jgi:hypothetical protein